MVRPEVLHAWYAVPVSAWSLWLLSFDLLLLMGYGIDWLRRERLVEVKK